jgi:hypothetical protein
LKDYKKMEMISYCALSATSYQSMQCNISEDRKSHFYRCVRLKTRSIGEHKTLEMPATIQFRIFCIYFCCLSRKI